MTRFPGNAPYRRRYADPQHRPSNQLWPVAAAATRQRVRDIATWLDEQAVIAEATAALRGRTLRGDPGE